eukprot:TRINITY_DN11808_c0_g1_i1.p1 TRINITY_DN11808_c0_g1~~TRINITY_DN11808_c0_g1_i1.p1  ORF type:complete len:863 (+),score=190.25 TRINITY_DN11808_c0_g1_i1:239-2590(+)
MQLNSPDMKQNRKRKLAVELPNARHDFGSPESAPSQVQSPFHSPTVKRRGRPAGKGLQLDAILSPRISSRDLSPSNPYRRSRDDPSNFELAARGGFVPSPTAADVRDSPIQSGPAESAGARPSTPKAIPMVFDPVTGRHILSPPKDTDELLSIVIWSLQQLPQQEGGAADVFQVIKQHGWEAITTGMMREVMRLKLDVAEVLRSYFVPTGRVDDEGHPIFTAAIRDEFLHDQSFNRYEEERIRRDGQRKFHRLLEIPSYLSQRSALPRSASVDTFRSLSSSLASLSRSPSFDGDFLNARLLEPRSPRSPRLDPAGRYSSDPELLDDAPAAVGSAAGGIDGARKRKKERKRTAAQLEDLARARERDEAARVEQRQRREQRAAERATVTATGLLAAADSPVKPSSPTSGLDVSPAAVLPVPVVVASPVLLQTPPPPQPVAAPPKKPREHKSDKHVAAKTGRVGRWVQFACAKHKREHVRCPPDCAMRKPSQGGTGADDMVFEKKQRKRASKTVDSDSDSDFGPFEPHYTETDNVESVQAQPPLQYSGHGQPYGVAQLAAQQQQYDPNAAALHYQAMHSYASNAQYPFSSLYPSVDPMAQSNGVVPLPQHGHVDHAHPPSALAYQQAFANPHLPASYANSRFDPQHLQQLQNYQQLQLQLQQQQRFFLEQQYMQHQQQLLQKQHQQHLQQQQQQQAEWQQSQSPPPQPPEPSPPSATELEQAGDPLLPSSCLLDKASLPDFSSAIEPGRSFDPGHSSFSQALESVVHGISGVRTDSSHEPIRLSAS